MKQPHSVHDSAALGYGGSGDDDLCLENSQEDEEVPPGQTVAR